MECKQVLAEHVLSPTQPRSTRRAAISGALVSFAAAASAVGITAGAAASVADLVPAASSSDDRLIALCTDYVARDDLHRRTCAEQDAMHAPFSSEQDARWSALDDIALENAAIMGAIENTLPDLVATTATGLVAKARVTLLALRNTGRDEGGPLARSLARDMLQVTL